MFFPQAPPGDTGEAGENDPHRKLPILLAAGQVAHQSAFSALPSLFPLASWEEENKTKAAHFLTHKPSFLTICISFDNDEAGSNGAAEERLQLYPGNTCKGVHLLLQHISSSPTPMATRRTAKQSTELPRAAGKGDLGEGQNDQGHQARPCGAAVWAAPAGSSRLLQVMHGPQAKQI